MSADADDIVRRMLSDGYLTPDYPRLATTGTSGSDADAVVERMLRDGTLGGSGTQQDEEQSLASRGFESGWKYMLKAGGGAASYAGDLIGSDSLQQWGAEVAQSFADDMEMLSEGVPSFFASPDGRGESVVGGPDGFSMDNFIDWAAFNVPNAAGSSIPGALAVAIGAAATPVLGSAAAGASIGAGLAVLTGIGSVYSEQLEGAREAGHDDPNAWVATGLGPLYGGMEYFFGVGAQIARRIAKRQTDEVATAVARSLYKRVGQEAGKGVISEAMAESVQTAMEEIARRSEMGESVTDILADERTLWAIKEGAVAGAVGGGALGGTGGLVPDRQPEKPPPDPNSALPEDLVNKGREIIDQAVDDGGKNSVLGKRNLPSLGEPIYIDRGDGNQSRGSITDVTVLPTGEGSFTFTGDDGLDETFDLDQPGINIAREPTTEEREATAEEYNFQSELNEMLGNAAQAIGPEAVRGVLDEQLAARGMSGTEELSPDQHRQFASDVKKNLDKLTTAAEEQAKQEEQEIAQAEDDNYELAVVSANYEDMIEKYRAEGISDADVTNAVNDAAERLGLEGAEGLDQVPPAARKPFSQLVERSLKQEAERRKAEQEALQQAQEAVGEPEAAEADPGPEPVVEEPPEPEAVVQEAAPTEEAPPAETENITDIREIFIESNTSGDFVRALRDEGKTKSDLEEMQAHLERGEADETEEGVRLAHYIQRAINDLGSDEARGRMGEGEHKQGEVTYKDGDRIGAEVGKGYGQPEVGETILVRELTQVGVTADFVYFDAVVTKVEGETDQYWQVEVERVRGEPMEIPSGTRMTPQEEAHLFGHEVDNDGNRLGSKEWWDNMSIAEVVQRGADGFKNKQEFYDSMYENGGHRSEDIEKELEWLRDEGLAGRDNPFANELRAAKQAMRNREQAAGYQPEPTPEPAPDRPPEPRPQDYVQAKPKKYGKGRDDWGALISKEGNDKPTISGTILQITTKKGKTWRGAFRKIEKETNQGWIVSYDRLDDEAEAQEDAAPTREDAWLDQENLKDIWQGHYQGEGGNQDMMNDMYDKGVHSDTVQYMIDNLPEEDAGSDWARFLQEAQPILANRETEADAAARLGEEPEGAEIPKYGSTNTIVTEDEKDAALAELNALAAELGKGSTARSGVDPDTLARVLVPATKVGLYHIEAGTRKFVAFSRKMIEDTGEWIKPYLKSIYLSAIGRDEAEQYADEFDSVADVREQYKRLDELLAEDDDGGTTGGDGTRGGEPVDDDSGRPLEGAPSGDVSVPEAQEPAQAGAAQGGGRGPRDDVGTDRPGDGETDSEGTGDEGVSVPPDGGRDAEAAGRPDAVRPAPASNYVITDADAEVVGKSGDRTKIKNNIAAIELVKKLKEEDRQATDEEKSVLVRYVGWGGLAAELNEDAEGNPTTDDGRRLKELLTDEEWKAARRSTINAHYTSLPVIRGIWRVVERLGFTGGKVLEPAVGIGHFIGMIPDSLRSSKWTAVDRDTISADMARQLYPKARVLNKPYQKATLPDGSYDLVISNVPFGTTRPFDPKHNPGRSMRLHDFYVMKSIMLTRPGGLVAVISTKGTMDKQATATRQKISSEADFLGAIRLPDDAFKANAGTIVTTDILFFRRKHDDAPPLDDPPSWLESKKVPLRGVDRARDGEGRVNEYYLDNERGNATMLGEMVLKRGRYGPEPEEMLSGSADNLDEQITEAMQYLPESVMTDPAAEAAPEDALEISAEEAEAMQNNSFSVRDGVLVQRKDGEVKRVSGKNLAKVKQLVEMRDVFLRLLRADLKQTDDAEQIRADLNRRYDEFAKKHGTLTNAIRLTVFSEDPDAVRLAALEVFAPGSKEPTKSDMLSRNIIRREIAVERVETAEDALSTSLAQHGRVDVNYMARLMGQDAETITETMDGTLIFNDPNFGWVSRDEYLSGDVVTKLEMARDAGNDAYAKELEAVQPPTIKLENVKIKLGATWLPQELVMDFVRHFMRITNDAGLSIRYVDAVGKWAVDAPDVLKNQVIAYRQRGVERVRGGNFYDLLQRLLNGITAPQFKTRADDGRMILLQEESARAKAIIAEIMDGFENWVMTDNRAHETAEREYNLRFNRTVERDYDGSHLTFPGMNPDIQLKKHQADAVWRILQSPGTYLAHDVGTGKTFTFITAAMEARRMGLARKPVLAVLKKTAHQIARDAHLLYPGAKILFVSSSTKGRPRDLAKLVSEDWDLAIMSHEIIGKGFFNLSREAEIRYISELIAELQEAMEGTEDRNDVKAIESQIEKLEDEIEEINAGNEGVNVTPYDESGVDMLMVDEAHEFKNVPYGTSLGRKLKGLNPTGSRRARRMMMMVHETFNGDGKVVMGSGTPLTNSIAELYLLQKYLQWPLMQEMQIRHFDSWLGNFAEIGTDIENAVEGGARQSQAYREVTRITQVINPVELRRMVGEFLDYATADEAGLTLPPVEGDTTQAVVIEPDDQLIAYLEELADRADRIRQGNVDPRTDNMLKVATDGRKAATDLRMVDPTARPNPKGKIPTMVQNAMSIYEETSHFKGVQLLFLDLGRSGTEGVTFNAFDEMRQQFLDAGVPPSEIVVLQDVNSESEMEDIFKQARNGDVRILVMSTKKGGTGVNVQDRVAAIHHLDTDWNIAGQIQRTGRGLRQGNKVFSEWGYKLRLFNYAVERTLDAFMWGLVSYKIRLFTQFLDGTYIGETIEDIGDTGTIDPDEMVALASGNPLVRREQELRKEVEQMHNEHRVFVNQRRNTLRSKDASEGELLRLEGTPERADQAAEWLGGLTEIRLVNDDDGSTQTVSLDLSTEAQQEAMKEAWNAAVRLGTSEYHRMGERRGPGGIVGYLGEHEIRVKFVPGQGERIMVPMPPFGNADVSTTSSQVQTFQRALQRMENTARDRRARIQVLRDSIKVYENELATKGETWPRQEELAEKQDQLVRLQAELGLARDTSSREVMELAAQMIETSMPLDTVAGHFVSMALQNDIIGEDDLNSVVLTFASKVKSEYAEAHDFRGMDDEAMQATVNGAVDSMRGDIAGDADADKRDNAILAMRDAIIDASRERRHREQFNAERERQEAEADDDVREHRPSPQRERMERQVAEYDGWEKKAWEEVRAAVERMSPTTVVTTTSPGGRASFDEQEPDAAYYPAMNLIAILTQKNPLGVIHHEIIHALKALGLLSGKEWRTLMQAARAGNWIEKHNIRDRYPELFTKSGKPTVRAYEEAIAEEFKAWAEMRQFRDVKVNSIFRRIVRFFRELGRRLLGKGGAVNEQAVEVFEDIISGRVGKREPTRDPGAKPDAIIMSKQGAEADEGHQFTPEIQEQWDEGAKGVRARSGKTPAQRVKGVASELIENFRRVHRYLPKTDFYANAYSILTQLGVSASVAMEDIQRQLHRLSHYPGTKRKLTKGDLDLVSKRMVMDDLAHDVRQDKTIPFFGNDFDLFKAEYKKLKDAMKGREDLKQLLEMRRRHNNALRDKMVDAGMLTEAQAKNPAYYMHQVLEYAALEDADADAVRQGKTANFTLKKPKIFERKGTHLVINTRMVETEYTWMYRAHVGIAVLDALRQFEKHYDKTKAVKDGIRKHNEDRLKQEIRKETRAAARRLGIEIRPGSVAHDVLVVEGRGGLAALQEIADAEGLNLEGEEIATLLPREYLYNRATQKIGRAFGLLRRRIAEMGVTADMLPGHLRESFNAIVQGRKRDDNAFAALEWLVDSEIDDERMLNGLAGSVFGHMNDRRELLKNIVGDDYMNPRNLEAGVAEFLGEDYVVFEPEEGLQLFMGTTIPQRIVDRAFALAERDEQLGGGIIDADTMRETMATTRRQLIAGGHKKQYVFPKELAKQLNNLGEDQKKHLLQREAEVLTKMQKVWTLINPRSYVSYNLTNLTGDLDGVVAAFGKALNLQKYLMPALRELVEVQWRHGEPTALYKLAARLGLFDAGWASAEVEDLEAQIGKILDMDKQGMDVSDPLKALWRRMKRSTTIRENWLRYAVFLAMKDRVGAIRKAAPNLPTDKMMKIVGYGASRRDEIDAISDDDWRITRIAAEAVGDYHNMSVNGDYLRKTWLWFYSWMEINIKRYLNLSSNAWAVARNYNLSGEEQAALKALGAQLGGKAGGFMLAKMGQRMAAMMVARAFLLYGMTKLYNHLMWEEEEEELTPEEQRRLHVIVGKVGDEVLYVSTPGSLHDLFQWVDLEDTLAMVGEVQKGRATWTDIIASAMAAPVNRVVNGVTPFIKTPLEMASGFTLYPSLLEPRSIEDRIRPLFKLFALDPVYDMVLGRPMRDQLSTWTDRIVRQRDVGESAYNAFVGMTYDYRTRILDMPAVRMSGDSERTRLFTYWKMALKYGDDGAARKIRQRMREIGIRPVDLRRSARNKHPMFAIPRKDRRAFMDTLTPHEQKLLDKAIEFWRETYMKGLAIR